MKRCIENIPGSLTQSLYEAMRREPETTDSMYAKRGDSRSYTKGLEASGQIMTNFDKKIELIETTKGTPLTRESC